MYTVLLVDDEEDVLKNLTNTIDWPVYGVENVLTAIDGIDACTQLTNTHIDLLITDISMPRMNGLDLLKHVRQTYPHTRCILLTSYSDFSYAKEAISLGVENYLVKPCNIEELDNSIRKSLDNISMHKHVMTTLFLDNILYRWITNDISSDELSERSKHIGVNIFSHNYCVVLLKSSHKKSLDQLLTFFFSSLKSRYDVYHFIDYDGHHVVILGGRTITQQQIADVLHDAITELSFNYDFLSTIGNIVDGYEKVPQSYQSALECLFAERYAPGQHICLASKKSNLNLTNLQLNLIHEYINTSSLSKEDNDISVLFHEIFSDLNDYSLSELNTFINTISAKLALSLSTSGQIDVSERDNILANIYHFEQFPSEQDLMNWLANMISICHVLIIKHTQSLSPIILQAIQYISNNFSDYVSIKDFCNRYKMNTSYLGLLFKKETGIYFNDYINQIRINHSISLIKNSNLKVAEICKRVGFNNTSYFILCFKKQTGLSPTKFKQLQNSK